MPGIRWGPRVQERGANLGLCFFMLHYQRGPGPVGADIGKSRAIHRPYSTRQALGLRGSPASPLMVGADSKLGVWQVLLWGTQPRGGAALTGYGSLKPWLWAVSTKPGWSPACREAVLDKLTPPPCHIKNQTFPHSSLFSPLRKGAPFYTELPIF